MNCKECSDYYWEMVFGMGFVPYCKKTKQSIWNMDCPREKVKVK